MSHLNDQIIRLYDTVFDRVPDFEGLAFWNGATERGLTLDAMADLFITAPEFAATYGQPDNASFVREMYSNVLDRPGDAGGLAFWTRVLDEGLADRGDVVNEFSESPEHIAQMAATAPSTAVFRQPSLPRDHTTQQPTDAGPYAANGDPKTLYTGRDGDVLVGGFGVDNLFALGFDGAALWGQHGDDLLRSWDGNDVLHGGAGNDKLVAGKGRDVLTGGGGDDTFVFQAADNDDVITDFERGDRISFTGIAPGQVRTIYTGDGGVLAFDTNPAREQEGTITFQGLTAADAQWVAESFIFA